MRNLSSRWKSLFVALALLMALAFSGAQVAHASPKPSAGASPLYIQCSVEKWVLWTHGGESYGGANIDVEFWILEDANNLGYCGQMENQTNWSISSGCHSFGDAFTNGSGAFHQQNRGTVCSGSGAIDNVYSPPSGCWKAYSWIDDPANDQYVSPSAKCI